VVKKIFHLSDLRAWRVLQDCKKAHALLISNISSEHWHIYWAATVVLLRTVGYVLKRVDTDLDETLKESIDVHWDALKSDNKTNLIFHRFIDEERDNLIHEYEQGAEIALVKSDKKIVTYKGERVVVFTYVIEGPFKGRRPLDLVGEAVQWWENYLSTVVESCNNANF
jgi:hypothetical protein